jgi:hypothetical protein
MTQPSEKALSLAEEILDFSTRGLTREDAIQELAQMIDEMNGDLVEAAAASLECASLTCNLPSTPCLAQLKRVVTGYRPLRLGPDTQTEFFALPGIRGQTNPPAVTRVGVE